MNRAVLLLAASLLSGPAVAQMMGDGLTTGLPRSGGPTLDSYAVGLQLISNAHYAEAVPYLEGALQQRPHNANILTNLGYAHRMAGDDYSVSIELWQDAITRDPDDKKAHEYLGEVYLDLKQPDKARAQLAELARICTSGCEDRDTLTKSIADYDARKPPSP